MYKFSILILCLGILGSCSISWEKQIKTTTSGESVLSYTDDIASTSKKITDSEEFTSCMKQNTNMCIQQAGSELARKIRDPAFCRELKGQDQQDGCIFAITITNAQEKEDEKLCESLTNKIYLNQCKISIYQQTAVSKKDIKICDKIDLLEKTQANVNNNDTNIIKDQCIVQFVMNTSSENTLDCERIQDVTTLEMCKVLIKNNNSTK